MLELNIKARRGSFLLEIECRLQSDWTVVFGPSGAGKSTLLRLLAGLDRPEHGRIALDGDVLTDSAGSTFLASPATDNHGRTATGVVPALERDGENVAYGLSGLNRATQNGRVAEMLELVDAADLAKRRPRDLSGGESQRVALARALPGRACCCWTKPFSALDGTASDALLIRLQPWLNEHRKCRRFW